jgi:hypothetical protein
MSKSETSDFGGERRKQSRSRGAWAPEFCQATKPSHEAVCVNARPCRRGREAERRKAHCPTTSAPTDKSAKLICARLRANDSRARLSALTLAALATGYYPDGSAPEPGFPRRPLTGVSPVSPTQKKKHAAVKHAPCGPVLVPVDRGPKAARERIGKKIRARAPHLAFAVSACRPERRPAQSEVIIV